MISTKTESRNTREKHQIYLTQNKYKRHTPSNKYTKTQQKQNRYKTATDAQQEH